MNNQHDSELNNIIEGFQMLGSDSDGLVNPNELKEIMDIMNMSEKNPFIYNIILSLCSDKEIQQKGGIEAGEFIALLDQELNDTSSLEGIQKLFSVFSDPMNNTIPLTTFSHIAGDLGIPGPKEFEIKNLVNKPEMNGKELNFNEFKEIVKTDGPQQSSEEHLIYKKKPSPENKRHLFNNEENRNINKMGINFNNNEINNNDMNFNSVHLRDSLESSEKNYEKSSNGNKASPKMITDEKNNNNYELDVDVNNFDNANSNQEIRSSKKKYRHMRKDNSNNNDGKNDKEKQMNEENNINEHINYSNGDEGYNENSPKETNIVHKNNNDNIFTKGKIEDIYKYNDNNNNNEEDKNDARAERRYHRRYRDIKTSTPDKKPEHNNNGDNNNEKTNVGYSKYRRKK